MPAAFPSSILYVMLPFFCPPRHSSPYQCSCALLVLREPLTLMWVPLTPPPLSPTLSPTVCIYVGQNVETVIREFSGCCELVTPEDDLVAEARRILGKRVQADGYVPPWRRFFGEPWMPDLPDKVTLTKAGTSELPDTVDQEMAELPGEEYHASEGIFHTLPPRYGGGGDAGMSPESPLGAKYLTREPANANNATHAAQVQAVLLEDEEVLGTTPAEPVRTGWSSMQHIQPAGWAANEPTLFSRGIYGCNKFHLTINTRSGKDGNHHAVMRYLIDMFGPRLVQAPHQRRLNPGDNPSLYEGKTNLHQAILAHDIKLVQFLVERGADVRARCIGSFFGAASHAYYGEYPLSFAICTGQKEIARYLVENGAAVNVDHDVHLCYALHMAVRSDRIASACFFWGGGELGEA